MNEHEDRIKGTIEKHHIESTDTAGSGAIFDDADIRIKTNKGNNFLLELKERTTNQNVAIPSKFIEKVKKQSLLRDCDWAIVYTNKDGKDYILLDLETFLWEIN